MTKTFIFNGHKMTFDQLAVLFATGRVDFDQTLIVRPGDLGYSITHTSPDDAGTFESGGFTFSNVVQLYQFQRSTPVRNRHERRRNAKRSS